MARVTPEDDEPFPCGLCGTIVTDETLFVHACCGCGYRDPSADGQPIVCPNCNP